MSRGFWLGWRYLIPETVTHLMLLFSLMSASAVSECPLQSPIIGDGKTSKDSFMALASLVSSGDVSFPYAVSGVAEASYVEETIEVKFFDFGENEPLFQKEPLRLPSEEIVASLCLFQYTLASGSFGGNLTIWNITSGLAILSFRFSDRIAFLTFSPDGTTLAAGFSGGELALLSLESASLIHYVNGHGSSVTTAAFSSSGSFFVSGSYDGDMILWNASSFQKVHTMIGSRGSILRDVAFSTDSAVLASCQARGDIFVWAVSSGQLIRHFSTKKKLSFVGFRSGVLLAGAKFLVSAPYVLKSFPFGFRVLNLTTGVDSPCDLNLQLPLKIPLDEPVGMCQDDKNMYSVFEVEVPNAYCAVVSPDSSTLALSTGSESVSLFSTKSGQTQQTFSSLSNLIYNSPRNDPQLGALSFAFSPDGLVLATGLSIDVVLWSIADGGRIKTLIGHEKKIIHVTFSPDGSTLASGSVDGTVILWNLQEGVKLRGVHVPTPPERNSYYLSNLFFSGDDLMLVSATADDSCFGNYDFRNGTLWDMTSGRAVLSLPFDENFVSAIETSPDGLIATTFKGFYCDGSPSQNRRTIELWNATSGGYFGTIANNSDSYFTNFVFSPDKSMVAYCDYRDELVVVREIEDFGSPENGNDVLTFAQACFDMHQLMFTSDSKHLVIVSKGIMESKPSVRFESLAVRLELSGGATTYSKEIPKAVRNLDPLNRYSLPAILSPNGLMLATYESSSRVSAQVIVSSVETGEVLHFLNFSGYDRVDCMSFSSDSGSLAAFLNNMDPIPDIGIGLLVWKVAEDGRVVFNVSLTQPANQGHVALSPDGSLLAVAMTRNGVNATVWSVTNSSEMQDLQKPLDATLFAPDNSKLLGTEILDGRDKNYVWNLTKRKPGNLVHRTDIVIDGPILLAFLPNSSDMVAFTYEQTLVLLSGVLSSNTYSSERLVDVDREGVVAAAVSPDGSTLAYVSRDTGKVWLRDLALGKFTLLKELDKKLDRRLISITFFPEGEFLSISTIGINGGMRQPTETEFLPTSYLLLTGSTKDLQQVQAGIPFDFGIFLNQRSSRNLIVEALCVPFLSTVEKEPNCISRWMRGYSSDVARRDVVNVTMTFPSVGNCNIFGRIGAGEYKKIGALSVQCPLGHQLAAGYESCIACQELDDSLYSDAAGKPCIACRGTTDGTRCYPCPPGSEVDTSHSTCVQCVGRSFAPSIDSKCQTCFDSVNSNKTECVKCGPGFEVNTSAGSDYGCIPCQNQFYSPSSGSECIFCEGVTGPRGNKTSCTACGQQQTADADFNVCIDINQPQIQSVKSEECTSADGNLRDCLTRQGTILTIYGKHFTWEKLSDGVEVSVGTIECVVNNITDVEIVCALAASNGGTNLLVSVKQGIRTSRNLPPNATVSFLPPSINGTAGCETGCTEGEILTIFGTDFGSDAPNVLIAASPCSNVTFLAAEVAASGMIEGWQRLTCTLPILKPGSRAAVLVISGSAALSTDKVFVDYKPCSVGSAPSEEFPHSCSECRYGFSPDGLDCKRCEEGKVPAVDGLRCTDCPSHASPSPDANKCLCDEFFVRVEQMYWHRLPSQIATNAMASKQFDSKEDRFALGNNSILLGDTSQSGSRGFACFPCDSKAADCRETGTTRQSMLPMPGHYPVEEPDLEGGLLNLVFVECFHRKSCTPRNGAYLNASVPESVCRTSEQGGDVYIGPGCLACAKGYTQWSAGNCGACFFSNAVANRIMVAVGLAVVLLFIFILDKMTFADALKPLSESAVLLKQLTTAVTLQSLMTSYVFEWSTLEDSRIETTVEVSSAVVGTYGFGCLLEDPRDELKARLAFAVLFPFAIFLIAGLFWATASVIKPSMLKGASVLVRWISTTILVWSIVYTITVKEVASLFLCMDFGDTKSLLVRDNRVSCWVSDDNLPQDHPSLLRWWGTLGILFLVGFPLAVMLLMKHFNMGKIIERRQAHCALAADSPTLICFAYLANGYSPSVYGWEIVNFGRKIAIVAIPTLAFNQPELQIKLVVMVLLLLLVLQFNLKPFATSLLNRTEEMTLICSMFLFTLGSLLPSLRNDENKKGLLDFVVTAIILIICGMNLILVVCFVRAKIHQRKMLKGMKASKVEQTKPKAGETYLPLAAKTGAKPLIEMTAAVAANDKSSSAASEDSQHENSFSDGDENETEESDQPLEIGESETAAKAELAQS